MFQDHVDLHALIHTNGWRIWEDELGLRKQALAAELISEEVPAVGVRMSEPFTKCSLPIKQTQAQTYHPAPESPRPCATMMVDVWRLSAGTTIAAALDMIPNAVMFWSA